MSEATIGNIQAIRRQDDGFIKFVLLQQMNEGKTKCFNAQKKHMKLLFCFVLNKNKLGKHFVVFFYFLGLKKSYFIALNLFKEKDIFLNGQQLSYV